MGPLGCKVLSHDPIKTRSSWGFNSIPGYYIGPALHRYRSFTVFPSKTRASRASNIVEFRHHRLTAPVVSSEDKVMDAMSKIKQELAVLPSPNSTPQLTAIQNMQELFSKCKFKKKQPTSMTHHQAHLKMQHAINLQLIDNVPLLLMLLINMLHQFQGCQD